MNADTQAAVVIGITSVLTDGLVFILPMPIVKSLALPRRKRIGVGIVFATGSLLVTPLFLSLPLL